MFKSNSMTTARKLSRNGDIFVSALALTRSLQAKGTLHECFVVETSMIVVTFSEVVFLNMDPSKAWKEWNPPKAS